MDDQSVSVEGADAVPECNVGRGQTNYKTGSMSSERDAQLDELLIGGREQRPTVIVDYDEGWPARFDELASRINHALGITVLSVEHIGSTAVPSLRAKPIIDTLLIVMNVEEERAYVLPLESAGFVLRVREPGLEIFLTKPPIPDFFIDASIPGGWFETAPILDRREEPQCCWRRRRQIHERTT